MTNEAELVIDAEARSLAAIRSETTRLQLGADIVRLLDEVWRVIRDQGIRPGHNVVVYHGADGTGLDVTVGVEVFGDFVADGDVEQYTTPRGPAATIAHYGAYSAMAPSYAALERWCSDNRWAPTGVSWEVYGDPDPDPAACRTDLYVLVEPKT